MVLLGRILSNALRRGSGGTHTRPPVATIVQSLLHVHLHRPPSRFATTSAKATRKKKKSKTTSAAALANVVPAKDSSEEAAPGRSNHTFVPSAEQLEIVELLNEHNIIVSARPGSGKTATAQAIVAANPDLKILILTYSKRLQLETKQRLAEFPGCGVFTFHGFASRLFGEIARTDAVLYKLRRERRAPLWTTAPYDIIILDEVQDCTEVLFWLFCNTVIAMTRAANGKAPRLVVLGDERQAIHEFRAADARYLTHANENMQALTPYGWKHKTLTKSFRLSLQCARFVNKALIGEDGYIVGSHTGPKPIYLHVDQWEAEAVASELLPLIQKYGPANTAILSMTVDKNATISRLTNILTERFRIPVATPVSDDFPLDNKVVHDKLCVSTFHQFKGNERDLIIVYGMDDSYFKWGAKDANNSTCPNAIYVAATRARKQLVLLHHSKERALPFMSVPQVHKTAKYINIGAPELVPNPARNLERFGLNLPAKVVTSKMAKHVEEDVLQKIIDTHLVVTQTQAPLPSDHHINSPDVVLSDMRRGHHEAVSDLNGIAIVAAYEHSLLGTLNSLGLQAPPRRIPSGDKRAIWFCKEACEYDANISTYRSRLFQLKGHPFDWLIPYLDVATDRLKSHLPHRRGDLAFEVPLEAEFSLDAQKANVIGRADIVALEKKGKQVTIWEIKCVAELSPAHIIQTCTYGYLWAIKHGVTELPCMRLYNVRSGEEWLVEARLGVKGAKALIENVLRVRHTRKEPVPAEEFVKRCDEVREEVEEMFKDEPV